MLSQGAQEDDTENQPPADLTSLSWWPDATDVDRIQLMQTQQTNRLLTRCCGLLESLHRKSPLAANVASQDVGVHLTKAQLVRHICLGTHTSNSFVLVTDGDDNSAATLLVHMQNKMREQVNKATVLTMNDNTWYLNDQHYDAVVVKVLGKVDVAAAKENWPLYITVVGMAEVAARNHRAETGTNITKEFADKWYGENDFPFTQEGVYVSRIATDYLKDNFFRTSGRADYFGCEEYREIIWNAYPDPNPAAADDLARDLGHNHIAHMSAPALAFVEIKVPVNPLHMLCLLTGNFSNAHIACMQSSWWLHTV
ncbi:TPA: hypothetical protein ACH3X2_000083 [Trebouxia sp. C0005]